MLDSAEVKDAKEQANKVTTKLQEANQEQDKA